MTDDNKKVSMTARCRFRVSTIAPAYPSTPVESPAKRLILEAMYDDEIAEDVSFSKYTPCGRMDVVIDNPSVSGAFRVGDYVYVDITKIGG